MPATEREASRDSEVRHQHSWSESGRMSVPMWDSSDPDRAPPPLPLNPTHSPTTKANTSAGIAAAARQIVERARESQPLSSYTSNNGTPQGSPERSLIKGAHHKRMQSLQTGNVKDLRNYLDNRSPERSPERPVSGGGFSSFSRQESKEDIFERSSTPTPAPRDPLKDTPSLRPSTRPGPRPLLGENTPPSATMLALQTMQVPEQPLHDVTNGPATPTLPRSNSNFDRSSSNYDLSSQLLNLTSIATNLQKEMTALSRRSKDNATDLLSLKDATNKRDEEIHKSLRRLGMNLDPGLLGPPPVPGEVGRSASSFATFLDNKPFNSPPSAQKSYSVPRAASAHSFLEERIGSPSPFSIEGTASMAMLEKIIRDMVTKDGQDHLQRLLTELLEKSQKENVEAARKVEELSEFIKEKSGSQAIVRVSKDGPPKLDLNFDSPNSMQKTRDAGGKEARMIGTDSEIIKMLEHIKSAMTHTGGTTSEVKGIVRDLRGEILGMGRDLGQKLEKVSTSQLTNALDRSIEDGQGGLDAGEVQSIIDESIADLKTHISNLMQQRAEEDDNTFKQLANTRGGPDGEEMLAVIKHALSEHADSIVKHEPESGDSSVDREAILEVVKEGLEGFEPDISIQQFGLEREEILDVLKQGFEDHSNSRAEPAVASVDKGEVFEAVQEALKDFRTPLPDEQIEQMREELLGSVRQALEQFSPPPAGPADDEATRFAVIEAVKEGLANHGPSAPREMEISREDLFDAVKASLDGSAIPFGGLGEEVLRQLQDLVDGMRVEFQQYIAANGRDTEQVLDAVKDGLESLRGEIESYVDRAQDVTGKDEIVDALKDGLEQLRADTQGYVAEGPTNDKSKADMVQYLRSEFEHLHEVIGSRDMARDSGEELQPQHAAEVILALKEGMEELKSHVGNSRSVDGEESGPSEEMLEAMKEEFEQLKTAVLNANANDKSELIETIQDSLGALHARFNGSEMSGLSGGATEDIINEMHTEFSQLKESLHSIIGDADRDAIVSGVKQSIDDLRTQLSADQSDAAAEALGAIKEELEGFKESMGSSVVVGGGGNGQVSDETLESIRTGLDEIKESVAKGSDLGLTDELLEAIQGEFDKLRNGIATSVAHGGSQEEVLDAVRLGLDDLRSHIDKKSQDPEQRDTQHTELLDAINEGLESLHTDVIKTLDKPLDMTVNYEILDTLKEGLAGLRADIDKLKSADGTAIMPKGGEIVLADGAEVGQARDVGAEAGVAAGVAAAAATGMNDEGVEKIEMAITQLQMKIDAMSASLGDLGTARPAAESVEREDIIALKVLLKDIQDSVVSMAEREQPAPGEGAAMKEDTDAIETLLRNTKSQLEDMAMPDPANVVTKDQMDALEATVRVTNEGIDGLVDKLENTTAGKADVAVVEVLAQDLKTAMDELKDRMPVPDPDEEKPELMTKADLDILGVMCTDIKTRVNEMVIPDPEELPSKADVEQLHGLITDFRESHDKLKESYETDIAVTAKAFDDRKQEFEETVQQLTDFKDSLSEMKEELLAKLGDGETGIDTLGETLKSLEEKTSHEPVTAEIQSLLEKVKEEFERAHGSIEAIKVDHNEAAESSLEKQAEHKEALVTEIGEKLETYFDGLMSKYDDAQHAAEEKAKGMEENAAKQDEMLTNMKTMTDDLRLSIDTLGSTLTAFPETMEKMTEESKTVFNKVDDTYNKLDETQEGLKFEHSVTRDEVAKVLAAIGGLQSDLSEHNPRFMVTLKEVQAMLGQHYEHSQKASDAAAEHAQAVKELQEQVRGIGTQNEELKTNMSSLPQLMPAPSTDSAPPPEPERYDDTVMHEKLDKLVGHAEEASKGSAQLERLDQIHEKVMATAAEVSAFVATQAKQITEEHESKEREAEELALLLERRQAKKDEIEDDITVLNDEKDTLRTAVEALRAEKEALTSQKSRLAADVSSLETAMHIRREELHEMDKKAEGIERRMLEGVMNQSRMLLLAKSAKPAPSPKKKPQGRDLRVPSNASATSAQTVTSSVPAMKANHSLAMKSRPGMQRNGALSNTAERRIMSLNQINNNVAYGGSTLSSNPSLASQGMKRSHSVKTQYPRKPSWAGKRDLLAPVEQNKENETLSEESEDELQRPDSPSVYGSDAATERRTSLMSGRDSYSTYPEGSGTEGITPGVESRMSYGTSDLSYGTGSYMTGSEIDRRTSLGSSAEGVVAGGQSVIDEEPSEEEFHELSGDEGEGQEEQAEAEAEAEEAAPLQLRLEAAPGGDPEADKQKVTWPHAFDSALGSDMPTAALSSVDGGSYFGR
ncbi:uncharacterized protein LTR77_006051 [Saxophila tyrrhenica]|uniref:Chromosome segregation ATPase family protein n=1 Tax=Saxophila tyrrhenica TaxID=1690608 RepID=A0AAV9P9T7_9PEZI|nr:hypothetical protein LTR77_006051 [Saxophila tyrrhenica]